MAPPNDFVLVTALSAVATALLYSLVFGVIGVVWGLLVGAALRVVWGLVTFFVTGAIASFLPRSDWLRVLAARALGSLCFVTGLCGGCYEGWTMKWTLLRNQASSAASGTEYEGAENSI